eukprot:PLAT170.4.p1 GENE.PLAT170.4~~PLAT170.4.p1  ORF type:complete len:733 (-),score=315.56 PLAT170.4:43-2241(-)
MASLKPIVPSVSSMPCSLTCVGAAAGECAPASRQDARACSAAAAGSVMKQMAEQDFYLEVLLCAQRNREPYPYHFIRELVRGSSLAPWKAVTPFRYYSELFLVTMAAEASYDVLPNFTAVDGLRLLGVGRNEYISLMNVGKSKWKWRLNRQSVLKGLLPTRPPAALRCEPWWEVRTAHLVPDIVEKLAPAEYDLLMYIRQNEKRGAVVLAGTVHLALLQALYAASIIYFVVPVVEDDVVQAVKLKRDEFVMNCTSGDPYEKLMYNVLLALDGKRTLKAVADMLSADIRLVVHVASLCLRLNFLRKLTAPVGEWNEGWTADVLSAPSDVDASDAAAADGVVDDSGALLRVDGEREAGEEESKGSGAGEGEEEGSRLCLLFNAEMVACLMMGNLSQGLKEHAMTLFEVGKLSGEALDAFMAELEDINAIGMSEGDAASYFTAACNLRETLRFMKRACGGAGGASGVDMVQCESLDSLDSATRTRLLRANYRLIIPDAALPPAAFKLVSSRPIYFGPPHALFHTPWARLLLFHAVSAGPPALVLPRGYLLSTLPAELDGVNTFALFGWRRNKRDTVDRRDLLARLKHTLKEEAVLLLPRLRRSTCLPLATTAAAGEEQHLPLLRRLLERLRLQTSLGYLELRAMASADDDEPPRWVPFQLCFGMPLADERACQAACRRFHALQLASTATLASHTRHMRSLTVEMTSLVARYGSGGLPAAPLLFDGHRLRMLEEDW